MSNLKEFSHWLQKKISEFGGGEWKIFVNTDEVDEQLQNSVKNKYVEWAMQFLNNMYSADKNREKKIFDALMNKCCPKKQIIVKKGTPKKSGVDSEFMFSNGEIYVIQTFANKDWKWKNCFVEKDFFAVIDATFDGILPFKLQENIEKNKKYKKKLEDRMKEKTKEPWEIKIDYEKIYKEWGSFLKPDDRNGLSYYLLYNHVEAMINPLLYEIKDNSDGETFRKNLISVCPNRTIVVDLVKEGQKRRTKFHLSKENGILLTVKVEKSYHVYDRGFSTEDMLKCIGEAVKNVSGGIPMELQSFLENHYKKSEEDLLKKLPPGWKLQINWNELLKNPELKTYDKMLHKIVFEYHLKDTVDTLVYMMEKDKERTEKFFYLSHKKILSYRFVKERTDGEKKKMGLVFEDGVCFYEAVQTKEAWYIAPREYGISTGYVDALVDRKCDELRKKQGLLPFKVDKFVKNEMENTKRELLKKSGLPSGWKVDVDFKELLKNEFLKFDSRSRMVEIVFGSHLKNLLHSFSPWMSDNDFVTSLTSKCSKKIITFKFVTKRGDKRPSSRFGPVFNDGVLVWEALKEKNDSWLLCMDDYRIGPELLYEIVTGKSYHNRAPMSVKNPKEIPVELGEDKTFVKEITPKKTIPVKEIKKNSIKVKEIITKKKTIPLKEKTKKVPKISMKKEKVSRKYVEETVVFCVEENKDLYVFEEKKKTKLYKVKLPSPIGIICRIKNDVFFLSNNSLFKFTYSEGKIKKLNSSYKDFTSFYSVGEELFAVKREKAWKVDTKKGSKSCVTGARKHEYSVVISGSEKTFGIKKTRSNYDIYEITNKAKSSRVPNVNIPKDYNNICAVGDGIIVFRKERAFYSIVGKKKNRIPNLSWKGITHMAGNSNGKIFAVVDGKRLHYYNINQKKKGTHSKPIKKCSHLF